MVHDRTGQMESQNRTMSGDHIEVDGTDLLETPTQVKEATRTEHTPKVTCDLQLSVLLLHEESH